VGDGGRPGMHDQQVGTEDVVAKVVSSSIHYINYIEQKEITLLLSLGLASLCVTKRRRRSKALVALAIVFCASDDLWLEGEGLQAGTSLVRGRIVPGGWCTMGATGPTTRNRAPSC
jgi:hypothetical protein